MINLYKRAVLWNCRVLQHIPGFKRYGRWLERQYTERFWTFLISNMVVGWAIRRYANRALARWLEEKFPTPKPVDVPMIMRDLAKAQDQGRVDYYEGFTQCVHCSQWHHPDFPPEDCPTYTTMTF